MIAAPAAATDTVPKSRRRYTHARHHLHDSIHSPRSPRRIPCEEQEHLSLAEAWNAFRLFAEPDSADLYSEIELIERSWEEGSERSLARLTLGERYGF